VGVVCAVYLGHLHEDHEIRTVMTGVRSEAALELENTARLVRAGKWAHSMVRSDHRFGYHINERIRLEVHLGSPICMGNVSSAR
jgi:hypothetical protein